MYIAEINSTNDYLKTHPDIDAVRTDFQTAGRGQMGNGWESEKGKNILLSVRLNPKNLPAEQQWKMCLTASVVLWQTVADHIDDPQQLCIKWPNDLYYKDQKLAGMLIENTLRGNWIESSIVGIGLNINQEKWVGNAPNPTSLKCITGRTHEVTAIANTLEQNLRNIGVTSANWESLYRQHLYRKEGYFWWEERDVNLHPTMNGTRTEQSFEAAVEGITPTGELVLRRRNGEKKTYHFKQIKYIL